MSSSQKILKKLDAIDSRISNMEKSLKKLDAVENRMAHLEKVMKLLAQKSSGSSSSVSTASVLTRKGKIVLNESESSITVTGNTYDLKAYLKTFRAKWDPDTKGWEIQRKNITDYTSFKNHLNEQCSSVQIKQSNKRNTVSRLAKEVSKGSSSSPVCEIMSSDEEED